MTTTYKLKTTGAMTDGYVEWQVIHVRSGKAVYFGSYGDCQQWIEYNGHDDWN